MPPLPSAAAATITTTTIVIPLLVSAALSALVALLAVFVPLADRWFQRRQIAADREATAAERRALPSNFPPFLTKRISAAVKDEDEAAYKTTCAQAKPWLRTNFPKERGVLRLHMGGDQARQDGSKSGQGKGKEKILQRSASRANLSESSSGGELAALRKRVKVNVRKICRGDDTKCVSRRSFGTFLPPPPSPPPPPPPPPRRPDGPGFKIPDPGFGSGASLNGDLSSLTTTNAEQVRRRIDRDTLRAQDVDTQQYGSAAIVDQVNFANKLGPNPRSLKKGCMVPWLLSFL
ncbi:uncharacterized protein BKCO1_13000114 [Diplodia corticola]|uniref:Uncharacterized protein n=1 Tax=Diplodia corticola TaxID=236234 RepID=A0A1J9R7B7_9PEZI|nr:uncharacterized protein BKCO1_13000114 [Diplodia corticola]OJD36098.1 hypothetical protein BKCO1_13000114 [Diplodia corticola]